MKVVFFGTSHFAAEILRYLFENQVEVVAVITRPDRPFGRAQRVAPPPVKEVALKLSPEIPLLQPEKASTPEVVEQLKALSADLFIVVAYGEILKRNILEIPKLGCINVHASLLPKYRGAAPMQRALMDGSEETGVTIMEMVLEMDAGDMIEKVKLSIPHEMTYGELADKLCVLAKPALLKVIGDFQRGKVRKAAQDPALVTFAPKITPQEERIQWSDPAEKIHNQIRALSPAPGAWCEILIGSDKKRLKIKRSKVVKGLSGKPGEILSSRKEELIVACGKDALSLLELQLEGKKLLPVRDFLRGLHGTIAFS